MLGEGDPRIDERLEGADRLERSNAHRSELADLVPGGREPGCLQVEDDELGLLEQRVSAFPRQGDGCAGADDSAVAGGDLIQQRTGEPLRDRGVAKSSRAASTADRTPCSSSASTSRSSPSSASCMFQMKANICSLRKAALGGFGEIWAEPPGSAARPEAGSSVAPVVVTTGAPCVRGLGTTIAPLRRQYSAKPS